MNTKNLFFAIAYVMVISIWLSASLLYPQMNGNIVGWFMYFIPLTIALVLAFVKKWKMSYFSIFMAALTPAIEICWGIIYGLPITEIMNPRMNDFCFNNWGTPGYVIFIGIIPITVAIISALVSKRDIK